VNNEAEVANYVERYVRSGFYTATEIQHIVGRDIYDGRLSARSLRTLITQALTQQRAEEASWPKRTDCDRLDTAFAALEAQGIIALHNAGNTQSDGLSDASEHYHEAGGAASGYTGYCFYHWQDVQSVLERGKLYLAFGAIDGDDTSGVAVGRCIKAVLEATGFKVEWNGSIKTRLCVTGLRWQRRARRRR